MEGYYEVTYGTKVIGKVQVIRQGLYYRFICHCRLETEAISKLVIQFGNTCENLGVLILGEEGLVLDKKYPVKKFSEGKPVFYLAPGHDSMCGRFVPICPEEPFAYISKLKDAFLATRNGQACAMLKENVHK